MSNKLRLRRNKMVQRWEAKAFRNKIKEPFWDLRFRLTRIKIFDWHLRSSWEWSQKYFMKNSATSSCCRALRSINNLKLEWFDSYFERIC